MRLSVPLSWSVNDSGSELTLRRPDHGGAITISTYRHHDPSFAVDALDQCLRFLASRAHGDVPVRGSASRATAEFTDTDGIRWNVTVVASGNRFALATYNSDAPDAQEEREAHDILNGLTLDG